MELNYNELEKEVFDTIGKSKIMVLATCSKNRVTARNMSCVVINKKICFQTDKNFIKYNQILENPNVAFCFDNFQIEGVAKVKGEPKLDCNKEFNKLFKGNFKGSYEAYSNLPTEAVIEVEITFVSIWKYEGKQALREYVDFNNKKAIREVYNP